LPEYVDHIHGHPLTSPRDQELVGHQGGEDRSTDRAYYPSHPDFGEPSVVAVRAPPKMGRVTGSTVIVDEGQIDSGEPSVVAMRAPPKMGRVTGSTVIVDEGQIDSGNLPDETTSEDFLPEEGGDLEVIGGTPSSVLVDSGGCQSEDAGMEPSEIPFQAPSTMAEVSPASFTITLEFPGQSQPGQRYRVAPTLPVRRFYHLIADGILGCLDSQIRIYVHDECLMHLGVVIDRYFSSDPTQRTVYLYRDCVAQVRRVGGDPTGGTSSSAVAQKPGDESQDDVSLAPLRRVSTRVLSKRDHMASDPLPTPRRAVRDQYFYEPVPALFSQVSLDGKQDAAHGSSCVIDDGLIPPPKRACSLLNMERDGMFDDSPSSPTPSTEADTNSLVSRRERAICVRLPRRQTPLFRCPVVSVRHSLRSSNDANGWLAANTVGV
jgi:hypothetical protein